MLVDEAIEAESSYWPQLFSLTFPEVAPLEGTVWQDT